jgi:hypothetical protein
LGIVVVVVGEAIGGDAALVNGWVVVFGEPGALDGISSVGEIELVLVVIEAGTKVAGLLAA